MNDTTDAAKITPCGGVLNDLKAYIDNELGPARRLSVRAHLSRCAACREEAAALKRISDDFAAAKAAAGEGALSTALRERVLGRMNDVRAQMPELAGPLAAAAAPFWKRRPLATFGWATAALAAWFIAAPLLVPTFSGGSAPRSETASSPTVVAMAPPAAAPPVLPERQRPIPSASKNPFRTVTSPVSPEPQRIARAAESQAGGMAKTSRNPFRAPAADVIVGAPPATAVAPRASADAAASGFAASPGPVPASETMTMAPAAERKVRKEASLTLAVAKVEEASNTVEALVKDAGGFVASNNLSTLDGGSKAAQLAVRVPVGRFESVLGRLSRLGEVTAKSVTGEDITEQVSDAEQAEQVLGGDVRATEAELKARERDARDVWRRQQEIRNLRIQLAQTRARLALLRKQSALSAITITLEEKKPKATAVRPPRDGFLADMAEAGRAAVTTFQTAARLPVVLLIWVLAYAPLWVPLLIVYRVLARGQQQRPG